MSYITTAKYQFVFTMYRTSVSYCIATLHLHNSKNTISVPLHEPQMMQPNTPAYLLAGVFANKFQENVLDKGNNKALLNYIGEYELESRKTQVLFKSEKREKNPLFKELHLEFDYGVQATATGWWAVVPALGIEAFAAQEADLEKAVQEAVRLDFLRYRRLQLMQLVVSTQWYEALSWQNERVDLNNHTPAELERLETEKNKQLLPLVSQEIRPERRVLYGYEAELKQVAEALRGKYHRSILLVGKSGVGKTALVWELSRQASALGIQSVFRETTAATLIKELTGRTGWQDQLSLLCREAVETNSILFVRNLMELFEVGQYEGNDVSMGDYLRKYLANGELNLLSECTDEELAAIELRNPNYTGLFQIVRLEEPRQDLEDIIRFKVEDIARHLHIDLEPEAVREAIRLHRRYMPYSGFPGRPIRFLESVLLYVKKRKNEAEPAHQRLDRSAVIKAFCDETGMPPFMVDPQVPMDLQACSRFFEEQVFGQDQALGIVTDMLARVKTALSRQGKPIVSMLFVGPTGVGKTELAKVLALYMFGSRDKMLRFDMSEYSSPYDVIRLTGESYYSDGLLTSAVRREPFCVLLFDEIEKADSSFNDLLLQLLGEGRLTDSQGKLVNFCSTIVIMTSNIGAQKMQTRSLQLESAAAAESVQQDLIEYFKNEARRYFRPEIFNRIDQIVPFAPLPLPVVRQVVEREIGLLLQREGIAHRDLALRIDPEVYDFLCNKGYHPRHGARALQRSLQELLVIPLARKLNEYAFDEKLVLEVRLNGERLELNVEADPLKLELLLEELTHNEYMDYVSELRLNAYTLKEGKAFVQLLADFSLLQAKKRKNEAQFWSNPEQFNAYAQSLSLQERYKELRKVIDELEIDMALMGMNLVPLKKDIYESIKNWDKDFKTFKMQLLGALYPEYNTTFLGIYGKSARRFCGIYLRVCEQLHFQVSAQSVWYRASLYEELVEVRLEDLVQDGQTLSEEESALLDKNPNATTQRQRCEYYRKDYDYAKDPALYKGEPEEEPETGGLKRDRADDDFLGIELKIEGTGAHLLFENEEGSHLIVVQGKKNKQNRFPAYLTVTQEQAHTPHNLHHLTEFFREHRVARRTYSALHIEDSVLAFPKREIAPEQQPGALKELLERNFDLKIQTILV